MRHDRRVPPNRAGPTWRGCRSRPVPDPPAADRAIEILEKGAVVHPRMDDAVRGADQFVLRIAAQLAELGVDRPDATAASGDGDDRGGIDRLTLKSASAASA